MKDLRDFYYKSLEKAKALKLEKFAGVSAYENECLILNDNIEHMRGQIEVLDKRLKQEEQEEPERERGGKRSGCKQS